MFLWGKQLQGWKADQTDWLNWMLLHHWGRGLCSHWANPGCICYVTYIVTLIISMKSPSCWKREIVNSFVLVFLCCVRLFWSYHIAETVRSTLCYSVLYSLMPLSFQRSREASLHETFDLYSTFFSRHLSQHLVCKHKSLLTFILLLKYACSIEIQG